MWDLQQTKSLPAHLCDPSSNRYAGVVNNGSSAPLNYSCVAVFLAMRSNGLCKGSTFVTVVDALQINHNQTELLHVLDHQADVILTQGIEKAPEPELIWQLLNKYMKYYNSFENILLLHSSDSAPASNITELSRMIPLLRTVYSSRGSGTTSAKATEGEQETTGEEVARLTRKGFLPASLLSSFPGSTPSVTPVPVFSPVSVAVSLQPLPSMDASPLTSQSVCQHRRSQFDVISNVASLLNEVNVPENTFTGRSRRGADEGGDKGSVEYGDDDEDSSCGGGIMDKNGRVSIPLSFIVLFLIILVLVNVCLFSYALSKGAGSSEEGGEEEEEPAPKKEAAAPKQPVEEPVITRSNNSNLRSAPANEDKGTKESTPLLRSKGRDSRKKSADSTTPAPIYKTDSTEFWEIEADHGYNEV